MLDAVSGPVQIVWTEHALVKALMFGLTRTDVERWIRGGHAARERNEGSADWRVVSGSIVILYNHPDQDDDHVARVVTVWRRR